MTLQAIIDERGAWTGTAQIAPAKCLRENSRRKRPQRTLQKKTAGILFGRSQKSEKGGLRPRDSRKIVLTVHKARPAGGGKEKGGKPGPPGVSEEETILLKRGLQAMTQLLWGVQTSRQGSKHPVDTRSRQGPSKGLKKRPGTKRGKGCYLRCKKGHLT